MKAIMIRLLLKSSTRIFPVTFVLCGGTGCVSPHRLQTVTETIRAERSGKVQEVGMFTTESNARVVVVNANSGKFCSEPPPESQLTENQTFRLLVDAALHDQSSKSGEIKTELARTYAQGLQQLYKRSHSNAMFRDASYYMCQAYLNGALTDRDLFAVLAVFESMIPDPAARNSFHQQSQSLLNTLESSGASQGTSAYLVAQLWLAQLAFSSLGSEIEKFYEAEAKLNEGKAVAYEQGLRQVDGDLAKLSSDLGAVDSKATEIAQTTKDSASTIDSISQDVKALKTPQDPPPKEP